MAKIEVPIIAGSQRASENIWDYTDDSSGQNNNLKYLKYVSYLQNLYKKTFQLHHALIAGASNMMDENET